MSEGEEYFDDVNAFEPATGRGELGEHLDGSYLRVEGDLILEGEQLCLVNEGKEVGARAVLVCTLAGLVPRPRGPVFFLGAMSGVVLLDGCIVVGACGELPVVQHGGRVCGLVLGVSEDGAGGVTANGALEPDMERHIKEVLLELECVVVVRRPVNLQLLISRQMEQSDDFRDGGHRDDAGGDGVSAGAEARESGSFCAKED